MITLTLFVVLFTLYLIFGSKKDKKSYKDLARIESEKQKLPDINIQMHQMTAAEKALNLWPSDNDLLKSFVYKSDGSVITLVMKDGRRISCPLSRLYVDFDKVGGQYRFETKYNGTKFSFYKYPYVFSEKEWDIIISVLTLAGETRGVSIMGTAYKNISKVGTVLKIIKALS